MLSELTFKIHENGFIFKNPPDWESDRGIFFWRINYTKENELCVKWDPSPGDKEVVTQTKLVFFATLTQQGKVSPLYVAKKKYGSSTWGEWVDISSLPSPYHYEIGYEDTIRISRSMSTVTLWKFNFECMIGDTAYSVDPQLKIGPGTAEP